MWGVVAEGLAEAVDGGRGGGVGSVAVAVDAEVSAGSGYGVVAQGVELVSDGVAVGKAGCGVCAVRGGVVQGCCGGEDGVVGDEGPVAVGEAACGELLAVVGGGEVLDEGVVEAVVGVVGAVELRGAGEGGVQDGDGCVGLVQGRCLGVEGCRVGSGDDGDVLGVAGAVGQCVEEVGQVLEPGGEVDGVDRLAGVAQVLADGGQDGCRSAARVEGEVGGVVEIPPEPWDGAEVAGE
ncbi:hypothetical protein ACWEN3_44170 [Streptomyces sp. NPDC004561]